MAKAPRRKLLTVGDVTLTDKTGRKFRVVVSVESDPERLAHCIASLANRARKSKHQQASAAGGALTLTIQEIP